MIVGMDFDLQQYKTIFKQYPHISETELNLDAP